MIYHHIEANYQSSIDVNIVVEKMQPSTPAFCRSQESYTFYFFTDFLKV
jgi:hypothetical protein